MERKTYTIGLEITPKGPLVHGSGVEGNEQVLCRRECYLFDEETEQYQLEEIPCVSGSSMKAVLREEAVRMVLEACDIEDGTVGKDALRLLLKGGKMDKGGASVKLSEARRIRRLFPLISVFGAMDAGIPLRASVQVSDVLPYCKELVNSGVLGSKMKPMSVEVCGQLIDDNAPSVDVFPGLDPIEVCRATTVVTHYRHDMGSSSLAGKLDGKPGRCKEENESMPYSAQAIAAGIPMFCSIRLHSANQLELSTLILSLLSWIQNGGNLGGGVTKGHGSCNVRIVGIMSKDSMLNANDVGDLQAVYGRYIDDLKDDIVSYVS